MAYHEPISGPGPNPIAGFEDWPAAVRTAGPYRGADAAATALGSLLGLRRSAHRPAVIDEGSRTVDGITVRRLRWSVGYGPDTTAWLLRPSGSRARLPAVLGMHCHAGVRSVGAEQLVDLGADASPRAIWLRDTCYAGRAPANELARRGHAVLVHDTFSWASRRFDLSVLTPRLAALVEAQDALWRQKGISPTEDERFDFVSRLHEDTVAKAAGALGQTFAGAVLTDDLVAFGVLAGEDGVDDARLGTFGFSGGGGRSLLLAALDPRVAAGVISCMMATFASLVPAGAGRPLVAAARPGALVVVGLAGPDHAGPGAVPGPVPGRRRVVLPYRHGTGSRAPPRAPRRKRAVPRVLQERRPRIRRCHAGGGVGLPGRNLVRA
jgi:dienelactone hydrolase